ncbi:hypothetical protein [Chryseobacterium sp.]|uniref:tetratricopeptide repeat protein n=1 Tax=Chryseobacterium sp. TaxID=1871047 RepID=UPI00321A396A
MKKIAHIIFLFLFQWLLISCNSPSPDKLSASFDIPLIQQSESLIISGSNNDLITLNTNYLQIAKEKKYKDGEALCYIYIASAYFQTGNYDGAQILLKRVKDLLSESNNMMVKTLYFTYNSRLNVMLDLYSKGFDYNSKAIYYAGKIKDKKTKTFLLSKTYKNRGKLFQIISKYDSSLIYFHKALKIAPSPRIKSDIALLYLWSNQKIDSSFIYTSDALKEIQKKKTITTDAVFTYFVAATYYREIKEFGKAKEYLDKSLEIMDKIRDPQHEMYVYLYCDKQILAKKMGDKKQEAYYYAKFSQAKDRFGKQKPHTANTINEEFLSEIKNNEKKSKIHTFLYIAFLSILLFFVCIYAYKQIKTLKSKKAKLKDEAEVLKHQVHDRRYEDLIKLIKKNDSSFFMKFKETYPELVHNLLVRCPDLETSELVFCAMLKLNFTSKEIATYLFILPKSAQQRKSRIRKRLNISSEEDIYDFINSLG